MTPVYLPAMPFATRVDDADRWAYSRDDMAAYATAAVIADRAAIAQLVNPAPFYPLSGDFLAWVAKGEMLLAADGWGPIFHFGVWWGERPWRVWNEMERLKRDTKERSNG